MDSLEASIQNSLWGEQGPHGWMMSEQPETVKQTPEAVILQIKTVVKALLTVLLKEHLGNMDQESLAQSTTLAMGAVDDWEMTKKDRELLQVMCTLSDQAPRQARTTIFA